jgi:energy-coupling factor transporter ATP-binding protein EcfA2
MGMAGTTIQNPESKFVQSWRGGMRIQSIRIQNFRAFKDQCITLGDYTCLVGPNGSGKSTILTALSILFRYSGESGTNLLSLDEEDFHNKDTSEPIMVTGTFTGLSAEAKSDFANYYRQDKLIISAVAKWDAASRTAPVLQFGQRLAMEPFAPFFKSDGDGAKVDDLRKIYVELRLKYSALPAPGAKAAMLDALRKYEEAHPDECTLIQSQDQFYGFGAKGKDLLEKYLQWVFVPAVKDASSEQLEARRTALGQILERTVRSKMSFSEPIKKIRDDAFEKYTQLIATFGKDLNDLSLSLTKRLRDWAHPDARVKLMWQSDLSKVSIADPVAQVLAGEGAFEGHLPRFGHGFQRSFLLALLQELASVGTGEGPTLVLACEEPELYQHPPQIRHLASVFDKLSSQGNQVLVCTHNPLFVRGEEFEEVRLVSKDRETGEAVVQSMSFDALAEVVAKARGKKPTKSAGTALKVSQALQPMVNEMFFTSVLVLVEGLEDVAYISTYLVLADLWQEFRRLGGHIVPCQGKTSMVLPLVIAKGMQIPTFVVFDADTDKCGMPDRKKQHELDNSTLLNVCGLGGTPPLPDTNIWSEALVMWKEDIAAALADDLGKDEWEALRNKIKAARGVGEVSDIYKCTLFIQQFLADAWDDGKRFPTLERLNGAILKYAQTQVGAKEPLTAKAENIVA